MNEVENIREEVTITPARMITLRCEDLTKTYKDGEREVPVLHNLNLDIASGECIAIIGPSGSGKSTLLHCLGGLERPTSGRVLLMDKDLNQLPERELCEVRNKYLGFIYQFHHLLPEFTAEENVAMPLLVRGDNVQYALSQARELLERVGLGKRLTHRTSQLSGGERQRTAIARALVTKPRCVLADEPTGNLDHQTAADIYQTLLQLNQELETSIVVVTHDLRLAEKMERIITLENGCLS